MAWAVSLHPECDGEFELLSAEVRDEFVARLMVLAEFGPGLGRPNVDTLKGSNFSNMKELRFRHDGVRRFAFAFDPRQQAIMLYGGDKEGENQKAFYRTMIRIADRRFADHLKTLSSVKKRS